MFNECPAVLTPLATQVTWKIARMDVSVTFVPSAAANCGKHFATKPAASATLTSTVTRVCLPTPAALQLCKRENNSYARASSCLDVTPRMLPSRHQPCHVLSCHVLPSALPPQLPSLSYINTYVCMYVCIHSLVTLVSIHHNTTPTQPYTVSWFFPIHHHQ